MRTHYECQDTCLSIWDIIAPSFLLGFTSPTVYINVARKMRAPDRQPRT